MKILQLKINNFQTHRNTDIKFSDGVNLICGESDLGKSSILRAIRWLFYNEPKGADFITHGETECEVTALLSNGYKVSRSKNTKTLNRYEVTDPNGQSIAYDNFGTEIPDEVKLALEVCYFEEDDVDELNLAQQGASNLILHTSSANRARIFNIFTGLDRLDTGLSSLRKDKLQLSKEQKIIESQKEEAVERLNTFSYVEDVDKLLEELTVIKDKYIKVYNFVEKLKGCNIDLHNNMTNVTMTETMLQKIRKFTIDTDKMLSTEDINKVKELYKVRDSYKSTEEAINGLYSKIDNLGKVLSSSECYQTMITKFIKKFNSVVDIRNQWDTNDSGIYETDIAIQDTKDKISNLESKYKETLKEAGVCPTCFRKIEEDELLETCILH